MSVAVNRVGSLLHKKEACEHEGMLRNTYIINMRRVRESLGGHLNLALKYLLPSREAAADYKQTVPNPKFESEKPAYFIYIIAEI